MNAKIIGMAVAGTAAVAISAVAAVKGISAKIVRSREEKKAKADYEALHNAILHDIKEYVDVMEDLINRIDPEADIDSLVPIAKRMKAYTTEIQRNTCFVEYASLVDADAVSGMVRMLRVIECIKPLYRNILDDIYCVQLSGHYEKMPELLQRDKNIAIKEIGILKQEDYYVEA